MGGGLLVLAAYRDDDAGPEHLLHHALADLRTRQQIFDEILITPMQQGDMAQLITASTRALPTHADALADLLSRKTAGNPFFVREFLVPQEDRWVWDIKLVAASQVTDNVVALMTTKLRALAPAEHHLFSVAACLGHEFVLSELCLEGKSAEAACSRLWMCWMK